MQIYQTAHTHTHTHTQTHTQTHTHFGRNYRDLNNISDMVERTKMEHVGAV
jgi:hypothetical protein